MRMSLVVGQQGGLGERVGDGELEEVRVRLECCVRVSGCSHVLDTAGHSLKKSLYMRGKAMLGSCWKDR